MDLQMFMDDFLNTERLQPLVKDLYELFDCPVMIVDVAFRVISWHHAGDFEDKPFQGTVERGELSYEIGSVFLGEHGAEQGAQFIDLKDSPFRRRFSMLRAGEVHVGYMILVDVHGTLEEVDPVVFSRVEAILAKQLLLRLSRDSQLKNSADAVLLHLLEGRFASDSLFRLQAEAAGLTGFAPARAALLNLELYPSASRPENVLRNAVRRLFPGSRSLVFNGKLILFLQKEPSQEAADALCRKYKLRMVISPRIHNLIHLPQKYACMQEIMSFLVSRISGAFAVYAEPYYGLMMFRHLSSRRDLVLPAVQALGRADREEGSLYCLTLYTYLCCHHSLQETCRILYTHRNTVAYRIRKIREEFGIPLEDPGRHAGLLMSCAVMLLDSDPDALLPDRPGTETEQVLPAG